MSIIITQPRGSGGSSSPVSLIEFQEQSNVVANLETTVFDYTNGTGDEIFLNQITAEGNARTEWFVYVNDLITAKARSSVSDLNILIKLFDFTLPNTDNIKVKVKHYETGQFIDYSTTLNYHA